jgi:hypothetical protein
MFRKRLDIAGIVSGISEGAAELANRDVDGLIEVAKGFVGPQLVPQLIPAHRFPWMLKQDLQQLQRLLLHSDL